MNHRDQNDEFSPNPPHYDDYSPPAPPTYEDYQERVRHEQHYRQSQDQHQFHYERRHEQHHCRYEEHEMYREQERSNPSRYVESRCQQRRSSNYQDRSSSVTREGAFRGGYDSTVDRIRNCDQYYHDFNDRYNPNDQYYPNGHRTTDDYHRSSSRSGAHNNNNNDHYDDHHCYNDPAPRRTTWERTMVEIMPGQKVSMHGSAETECAIEEGRTQSLSCIECNIKLVCVEQATLIICPSCRSIAPTGMKDKLGCNDGYIEDSLGLGVNAAKLQPR